MSKRGLGILLIVIATICYGFMPPISFLAFGTGLSTDTLLFSRFLFASILIWFYIFIKKIPFKLSKEKFRMALIMGLLFIASSTTMYLAFSYISGSLAIIISFTFPAMILTFEMIRGIEKVRLVKISAVILSMGGLLLVLWSPDININVYGVICALLSAVFYGSYILGLSSKNIKETNSIVVAGYVLLTVCIFNFFRCIFFGSPFFPTTFLQLKYILILSVFCSFTAILTFCMGVKLIGASNAAIINTFEPVVACVFGYLLINDAFTKNMLMGGLLVLIAVFIANLPAKSFTKPQKNATIDKSEGD